VNNDFRRGIERLTWKALEVTMDMAYARRKIGLLLAAMQDAYLVAESVQAPNSVRPGQIRAPKDEYTHR
jgi:hypothetical protein